MAEPLSVERVGTLIVAHVRGEPTPELLRECQERVLALSAGAKTINVLYDAREMSAPSVDVPWAQRRLDEQRQRGEGAFGVHLRRAIVVPDSRIAFLARLAFGEGDYRVFYDDVAAATRWLNEAPAGIR